MISENCGGEVCFLKNREGLTVNYPRGKKGKERYVLEHTTPPSLSRSTVRICRRHLTVFSITGSLCVCVCVCVCILKADTVFHLVTNFYSKSLGNPISLELGFWITERDHGPNRTRLNKAHNNCLFLKFPVLSAQIYCNFHGKATSQSMGILLGFQFCVHN